MFYADRNVRPCTILGYTLTTFPTSLIQTKKQQKHNLHQIASSSSTLQKLKGQAEVTRWKKLKGEDHKVKGTR